MRKIASIIFVFIGIALAGCPGSKTLEQGGPYQSIIMYQADYAVDQFERASNAFLNWCDRNPHVAETTPEVKAMRDYIKKAFDGVAEPDEPLVQYFRAKDIWLAMGQGEEGLDDFQRKLRAVQALTTELIILIAGDKQL